METLETSLETIEQPRLIVLAKWKHKWKQFPKWKHLYLPHANLDPAATRSDAAPEASEALRV
jgi:hypothetical protein